MGDPDRPNDPLQVCSGTDSGGVHSGSGVPNHAYARVLTDGATFNGITVNGIGLFKAAGRSGTVRGVLSDTGFGFRRCVRGHERGRR